MNAHHGSSETGSTAASSPGGSRRNEADGRHGASAAPALVSLGQAPAPGQKLVEPLVCLAVGVFRAQFGADAVAPLDLVGVREPFARERAGVGAEAVHLIAQPSPALRLEVGARRDLGRERVCVGREITGRDRLFGCCRLGELRRAVVGVHEAVDVPPEPQPEGEVPLDEVRHAETVCDSQRATSAHTAGAILPGRGLDFHDPWGNLVQIVQYDEVQFSKADAVQRAMGLELGKTERALTELRAKGIEPGR